MIEFRSALLSFLLLSACAPHEPIQVVEPYVVGLGGFYDPRYIPSGCVYTIDREEIKRC